ncbi:unnamed protein product [Symbiodinium sp. CCMP2592]|nr:unnamed protein product [Symbiodinium sp. CCMP2592]
MSVMRYRLGLRLGREVKCNNHNLSHAIEWSPDAQAECLLSARHEGGGCVFGNIADFFRSELKDSVIPQLLAKPAMTLEVLQPLLRTNRLVQTSAHCLVHGRTCCLKTCNRHIAGTSCRPFSKRGSGLGCNDQEIVYFMAWLGLRMLLQEPDVTQENVVGFPPDVIEQAVSSIYYMEVCELDAVQFGCACARRRQFIRLRHKEKVLGEISPLARFSTRFFRAVKYHWSEQLVRAALLEKCLEFYQADELDIPWFSDDGTRTVVRSELSRPIQEATVSEAIFRYRTADHTLPLSAGGFNHRAEAFYRCRDEQPDHPMVQNALTRGLRKVKVLHERTPDCVFKKVIVLLNAFHQGSGENHLDFLAEALGIEHAWRAECRVTQINTYNPRYSAAYDAFILSNKGSSPEFNGFFKQKNPYYTALALAHHLQNYGVYDKVVQWTNAFVDFLDPRYEPQNTINTMHAITSLIVTSQKKYCLKAKIGIIIFEAVKACVPVSPHSRAVGRTLSFSFEKGGADASKSMNLLNLPMETSSVVRKMALSTGGAGEGAEGRGGAMSAKGTGKSKINPSLAVKAELAQVESLKIQLKDTEAKKLGRPAGDRDIGQAQADAAEAQAQEPDSTKRKTKKSARGLTIKGYSDDERSSFSGVVTSCTSGATESRPLTALDDIIRALDYAMGLLKNKDMITEESATLDTFGFCISLWLEFAFQGKVSVAGREHRAYSLLRVDLQQTLLDANETLNTPGFVTLDSDGQKTCNALELARLLNENLTSQPVSEILWAEDDDGDERALRSVCEHMTCNRELTVVPWTAYISQKLHLPILMHQPVQDVVTSLLSESAAGRKYLLVDVISSLYSGICNILPPGMFGFAFDVAAAYGERKHFVEGTQEAGVFGNVDNLQKACSLRVTYLLELLKELLVLRKAGRIHLQVSEPLDGLIPKLHALRMTDPCFSNMVAFDAVQFATHWARDWTAILEKADSDDLMSFNDKLVAATEGLDTKDATQGTSSTTAKSITAASLFRSSSTNDIDIDGKDDDQANGGRAGQLLYSS